MIPRPTRRNQVFIVDAFPSEYDELVRGEHDTEFVFYRTGRDALRSNPESAPMMWVVNTQLPDMMGTDLQAMLQTRGCLSPFALIGDEYRVEDELCARGAGAALYFVKPLHSEMLLACCKGGFHERGTAVPLSPKPSHTIAECSDKRTKCRGYGRKNIHIGRGSQ
jgi:DNA-binding response OmpR family regulator